MNETSGTETKSSNEILSELFGAFNAEPPEIIDKLKTHSEDEDSDHNKKLKKRKRKDSRKKHKHKSKKHKRKHSNQDGCVHSESSSSKTEKKKKKKHKEKKVKRSKHIKSPNNVNIELSVNQVPMALEIMLDGTVGIKGEDGVVKKIPNDKDYDKDTKDGDTHAMVENGSGEYPAVSANQPDKNLDTQKSNEKKSVNPIKVQEVFEAEVVEQSEKQKKGKILIRDLKFSSVFQETVKAVEEKQKKEQERKADIEEGELSDSSGSEQHVEYPETKDKSRRKNRYDSVHHYDYEDDGIRLHTKDMSRESRPRSSSRSRSRSPSHRSRSGHHSRSRYSRDKSGYRRHRSRSRSRDYYSSYYLEHSRRKRSRKSSSSSKISYYSGSRDRYRSHSRSRRSREKRIKLDSSHRSGSKHRSKTKSEERSASVEKIDKEKLLAIARRNALKLIDAGMVPGSERLAALKAGGKTVNELTEYCKKLSKREALDREISDSESESSDDGNKLFHHPFQVRDKPNSIILNIKNSVPLPVKSLQEKAAEQFKQLKLQFPVSSGTSHRRTESEWIPVSPKREGLPGKPAPVQETMNTPLVFEASCPPDTTSMVRIPQPLISAVPDFSAVYPQEVYNRPVFPVIQPDPIVPKRDISSIVSKRLDAMRKLQENPNDPRALDDMYRAQQEMQYWAESKHDLGAFTENIGSTKFLTPSELSSGVHAWAKRNQFAAATPVRGGMGMALLQKMGWQPGEGLGKNKEGTLEPLRLEVKMDKKGLVASDESKKGKKMFQQDALLPAIRTLDGKHPVSLLNEFCSRRRYGVPQFDLCFECGPDHKKNFLFKVKVNGIEYTPTVASPNKKQAKAEAAAICLKALGVISNTT